MVYILKLYFINHDLFFYFTLQLEYYLTNWGVFVRIFHLCSVKVGFIISVLTRTKKSIDLEIERVRERKKCCGNYGILFLKRGHICITYMYSVHITQNSWIYRDLLCKYKITTFFTRTTLKDYWILMITVRCLIELWI